MTRATWPWLWLVLTAVLLGLLAPFSLLAAGPVWAWVAPGYSVATEDVPDSQRGSAFDSSSAITGVSPLNPEAAKANPAAIQKILDEQLVGPGNISAVVLDGTDGSELAQLDGARAAIPASNTKILTALAVLNGMNPSHRLATTVTSGQNPRELTLVAGGDVLLGAGKSVPAAVNGRAGLESLAERTVSALSKAKLSGDITVSLDDSLFSGEPLSSAWFPEDVQLGEIAGIYPLGIDGARNQDGTRPQDSALSTAELFVDLLRSKAAAAGLSVNFAAEVPRAQAPGQAKELARVESATVAEQTQYMLRHSDNVLAEVLGRLAAKNQGKAASSLGAVQGVEEVLRQLELKPDELSLADVNGLSIRNRIPATVMAQSIVQMISGDNANSRFALAGLPVAGQSGTLAQRFLNEQGEPGRDVVHAKTGTLNTAVSLAGYVVDQDERVLVFSFMADGVDGNITEVREILIGLRRPWPPAAANEMKMDDGKKHESQ